MSDPAQFNVRDSAGNVYGPATIATLRDWHKEGRVVGGMQIAAQGTTAWQPVDTYPGLADLFGKTSTAPTASQPAASTPAAPRTAAPAGPAASPAAAKGLLTAVKEDSPMAFWGAILAAVGVLCVCGCGALMGIAGAVMGLVALNQIKPDADPRVRTVAIAAMVLGGVALITSCCGTGILTVVVR